MDDGASNNTQAGILPCPTFAGRGKESFPKYNSMVQVCISLYNKAIFGVFKGKAQPSFIGSINDTATLNAVAERTWKQTNQDI